VDSSWTPGKRSRLGTSPGRAGNAPRAPRHAGIVGNGPDTYRGWRAVPALAPVCPVLPATHPPNLFAVSPPSLAALHAQCQFVNPPNARLPDEKITTCKRNLIVRTKSA
jgi:hypothetical protein